MVSAVCRLPFAGDEIVRVLSDLEPAAPVDSDEAHTTFWLVVADQLHRRGIGSPADERAVDIIDRDLDLRRREELGMRPGDLAKRRRALQTLRSAISAPLPAK